MIKAIIFDWDGVVVDSMPILAKGVQETAASYGVTVSIDDIVENYIQPREAYYKTLGIDVSDLDELNRRHWDAIHKHREIPPLFPETKDVLEVLVSKGYVLAIASTQERDFIIEQLNIFNIKHLFTDELIVAGEASKEDKLRIVISRINLPKDNLLYVGDLPSDITAARNVGIHAAGIERRESARVRLAILQPDYIFASLKDLESI